MKIKLLAQTFLKFIIGVIMFALLLFLPAGTLQYWNAWLLMGLLFIPMFLLGVVLYIKAPELLEKRLKGKEKEKEQKHVIIFTALLFLAGFVIAGLDFKFGWSKIPLWTIVIGSIIHIIAYSMYIEVMRENSYLSRTVEIQENQKVIDTGLYALVRHPMYLATTLLYLSFPIILGSWISLAIFLLLPLILAKRIKNEEKVLEEGLKGYKEYKGKVKFKMIPFIW